MFFPNGISNARDLTTYLAYRSSLTLEELGKRLEIDHLNHKTNPKQNANFSPTDKFKLHTWLQKELKAVASLALPIEDLDSLFPDPLATLDSSSANFRENFNLLARLCCGADAASFAKIVSKYSGTDYSARTVSSWGSGIGLSKAFPHILNALQTEPTTKHIMTKDRTDLFVVMARSVMRSVPQNTLEAQTSRTHDGCTGKTVFDRIVGRCRS